MLASFFTTEGTEIGKEEGIWTTQGPTPPLPVRLCALCGEIANFDARPMRCWLKGVVLYAPVPLPELGLGSGGRSGKATSNAATGRSRVDAALAQARVRTPLGKCTSTLPGPGAPLTTPMPKVAWVTRSPGK